MKKEHMRAFERWLDANYGDAHPSWIFMRNAWQAGVLYALTYSASQQGVQADARGCPNLLGGVCELTGRNVFTDEPE